MDATPRRRRSAYEDRLGEFPELVTVDGCGVGRRGAWGTYFRDRIGPGFDGRVVFEIGCFDADLLARAAGKRPNTGFVGLDWKYRAIYHGARRVTAAGLRNVALIQGRGQDVGRIFGDGEVDEAWVFHPDPCDTQLELPNRLVRPPFLSDVHRVLRDDRSVLTLKTDHPGYYQWVLALWGLPEPAWFAATRAGAPTPGRRVKSRELVSPDALPAASDEVRRRFDVLMSSADYWNDDDALRHTAGRPFAGEVTPFEDRFRRRRLPIYFFEARKRVPA